MNGCYCLRVNISPKLGVHIERAVVPTPTPDCWVDGVRHHLSELDVNQVVVETACVTWSNRMFVYSHINLSRSSTAG